MPIFLTFNFVVGQLGSGNQVIGFGLGT